MEPNTNTRKPARLSSWILRLLGVTAVALVAFSSPASAQLPAADVTGTASAVVGQVTGTAGASAGIPQLPMAVDQAIDTPLGHTSIHADASRVQLCNDLYAAAPALPFAVPVEAAAASAGCLDLSQDGVYANLAQRIAGQEMGLDIGADLPETPEDDLGFWAEAKGAANGAIHTLVDLF